MVGVVLGSQVYAADRFCDELAQLASTDSLLAMTVPLQAAPADILADFDKQDEANQCFEFQHGLKGFYRLPDGQKLWHSSVSTGMKMSYDQLRVAGRGCRGLRYESPELPFGKVLASVENDEFILTLHQKKPLVLIRSGASSVGPALLDSALSLEKSELTLRCGFEHVGYRVTNQGKGDAQTCAAARNSASLKTVWQEERDGLPAAIKDSLSYVDTFETTELDLDNDGKHEMLVRYANEMLPGNQYAYGFWVGHDGQEDELTRLWSARLSELQDKEPYNRPDFFIHAGQAFVVFRMEETDEVYSVAEVDKHCSISSAPLYRATPTPRTKNLGPEEILP